MVVLSMANKKPLLSIGAGGGLDLKVIMRTFAGPDFLCQMTFSDQEFSKLTFDIVVFDVGQAVAIASAPPGNVPVVLMYCSIVTNDALPIAHVETG